MRGKQPLECLGTVDHFFCFQTTLRTGVIPGSAERDDLFQANLHPLAGLHRELLGNVPRLLNSAPVYVYCIAVAADTCSRGLGDAQPGLVGLNREADGFLIRDVLFLRLKVAVVQVAVAGHPVIDDSAVQGRANLQVTGPVFRSEHDMHGGKVRLGHMHDAPFPKR